MNIKAIMENRIGCFYLCNKDEACCDSDRFIGYIDIDNFDDFVDLYVKGYGIYDIKDLMKDCCDKEFQAKVFENIYSYLTLELSAVESELAEL